MLERGEVFVVRLLGFLHLFVGKIFRIPCVLDLVDVQGALAINDAEGVEGVLGVLGDKARAGRAEASEALFLLDNLLDFIARLFVCGDSLEKGVDGHFKLCIAFVVSIEERLDGFRRGVFGLGAAHGVCLL